MTDGQFAYNLLRATLQFKQASGLSATQDGTVVPFQHISVSLAAIPHARALAGSFKATIVQILPPDGRFVLIKQLDDPSLIGNPPLLQGLRSDNF